MPSRVASSTSMATPPSGRASASAPQGRSQPPPSRRRKARSASTARRAAGSSRAARRAAAVGSSSGPALDGQGTLGHLGQHHRRFKDLGGPVARGRAARRAATATTTASKSAALATRVSMLPRSELEAEVGSQGRQLGLPADRAGADAARRRGCRRGVHRPGRPGGRPARGRRPAPARRPSPTGGPWPSGRRGRPARRGPPACTSFTNTPVPPMVQIGTSVRWSPVVDTMTSSASPPRRPATRSACHSASRLPRVAMRSVRPSGCVRRSRLEVEEGGEGVGVELAPAAPGGLLHPHRRARGGAWPRCPG